MSHRLLSPLAPWQKHTPMQTTNVVIVCAMATTLGTIGLLQMRTPLTTSSTHTRHKAKALEHTVSSMGGLFAFAWQLELVVHRYPPAWLIL